MKTEGKGPPGEEKQHSTGLWDINFVNYDFEKCKTRLEHYGPYEKRDVIAALRATDGNFSKMSSLLGRRRGSIQDYVLANLDVKDVYDEIRETILDRAEQEHTGLALGGDGPALRFILQTLGKDRGYSTRVEQTGKDGGSMKTDVTHIYLPENHRDT